MLASDAIKVKVPYIHVSHPSRWVTHLHSTRVSFALNTLLDEGVTTPRQLFDMATGSWSDKQLRCFLDKPLPEEI